MNQYIKTSCNVIVPVTYFLVFPLLLCSCSKEIDADSYIGDYKFVTSGELNAYMIQCTDGITHPTGCNESFVIEPQSGTVKIFRPSNGTSNSLCLWVTYESGEVVQIDAVINKANSIETLSFPRNILLYDKSGQGIVYDGRMCFNGEGEIVDKVMTIRLNPQSTFRIDSVEYGFYSSHITVVAEKCACLH